MKYRLSYLPIFPKKYAIYRAKLIEQELEERRLYLHTLPVFKIKGYNGWFVCLEKYYYTYYKRNYWRCIREDEIDNMFMSGNCNFCQVNVPEDDIIETGNVQLSIFDFIENK